MVLLLSELLKDNKKFENIKISLVNEKSFDVFARATTDINCKKCIFLEQEKYLKNIDDSVSMIITNKDIYNKLGNVDYGVCICDKPKSLYFELLNSFNIKTDRNFEKTFIAQTADISEGAIISDKNVIIDEDAKIEAGAIVLEGSRIGKGAVIHSGAIISAQDFNYYRNRQNEYRHIRHIGEVIIGDNVEIGYNTIVGRPLYHYDKTIIKNNTIIGFSSLIGHDAIIGEGCLINSHVVVGGHTTVGCDVVVGLGAAIKNGIVIGDRSVINMGAVVIRDVGDAQVVFGNPAKRIIAPR